MGEASPTQGGRGTKSKDLRSNSLRLILTIACCLLPLAPLFAGITVLSISPRIITPNGDGINDVFVIAFDNPGDSVISRAKVFDVMGGEVSDLQLNAEGDALIWNGQDKSGRARAGVYFYEVQAEGDTFSGALVVAK